MTKGLTDEPHHADVRDEESTKKLEVLEDVPSQELEFVVQKAVRDFNVSE